LCDNSHIPVKEVSKSNTKVIIKNVDGENEVVGLTLGLELGIELRLGIILG